MVPNAVQDHVVTGGVAGEVPLGVVDYGSGTQRRNQLKVSCAAYSGDLRSEGSRDLNGKRTYAAGRPIDEHLLPGPDLRSVPQRLQGCQTRAGHGRRLLEGQGLRFAGKGSAGSTRELRKGAFPCPKDGISNADSRDAVSQL